MLHSVGVVDVVLSSGPWPVAVLLNVIELALEDEDVGLGLVDHEVLPAVRLDDLNVAPLRLGEKAAVEALGLQLGIGLTGENNVTGE